MRVFKSTLLFAGLCALAATAIAQAPAIGAAAPDFQLTTLDGKAFSLSSAAKDHKAVVLMFISTQCPYSNAYNDQMKTLANAYASKGVLFAGITATRRKTSPPRSRTPRRTGTPSPS